MCHCVICIIHTCIIFVLEITDKIEVLNWIFVIQGDLGNFLKTNGPIKPSMVVRFALDIARYLTSIYGSNLFLFSILLF